MIALMDPDVLLKLLIYSMSTVRLWNSLRYKVQSIYILLRLRAIQINLTRLKTILKVNTLNIQEWSAAFS